MINRIEADVGSDIILNKVRIKFLSMLYGAVNLPFVIRIFATRRYFLLALKILL